MRQVITEEIKQNIKDMYASGLIIKDVALSLKISEGTVFKNIDKASRIKNYNKRVNTQRIVTKKMAIEMNDLHTKSSYTMQQIADFYNVTFSCVSHNVSHKKRVITVKVCQEFNDLYTYGFNNKNIGDMYGISHTTVGNYIWHPRVNNRYKNVGA